MQIQPYIGILFLFIALIFVGVALRDYLKTEGKMTIARKIWILIAFIFAGVGGGLFIMQFLK